MITNKPFALQLFSIHQDVIKDFPGIMKYLKKIGYDGVEFAGAYGREENKVKEICEDAGICPVSAHIGLDQFKDNIEGKLDFVQSLGVKHVVVPFLDEKFREGDGFEFFVKEMLAISKAARERGISLGYHNHNFEFNIKVDGDKYLFDHIFDSIGRDNINAEIDLGWLSIARENPVSYIAKYKGNVPLIHIKDFYFPDIIPENERPANEVDYFDFRPMGYGSLNVPAIIKAAEDAGTEWFVVEQDDKSYRYPEFSKLDCVKISIEYIKGLQ